MSTRPDIIIRPQNDKQIGSVRERASERARHYARQGHSKNTERAYKGDISRFERWCREMETPAFPAEPDAVAAYLASLADAGRKAATIQRAMAAIAKLHEVGGAPSPTKDPVVKATMAGIRRELGSRQEGKAPIMLDDLRAMVRGWDYNRALHLRNRCILTFVWWTAVRRSEAAAVDLEHLEWVTRDQVRFLIPFSKTDQTGEGQVIGIERVADKEVCPLHNLEQWTARAGITSGPLFLSIGGPKATGGRLSESSIYNVVKKSVKRADVDLDPDAFGAHSLRAGFVTQGYISGMREFDIRQVTRHKTEDMTRRYIRPASVFEHGAAKKIV
jgi:integrase